MNKIEKENPSVPEMYLCYMMSIPDIASVVETSKSSVRRFLIKSGVELRSRQLGVKNCLKERLSRIRRGKKFVFSETHKKRIAAAKTGLGAGVRICTNGYYSITRAGANKDRLVHVMLAEEIIGRRIAPQECIHHINGIKTDNRAENLLLMSRKQHSFFHAMERKYKENFTMLISAKHGANTMNRAFLKGRIGKSELKHSKTGTAFCSFSLATSEGKKNADGTWENETEWHNCVAFGKTAEFVDRIGKGGNAVVIGKIKTESWEKEGKKNYSTKIYADHVEGWISQKIGQTSATNQDFQVKSNDLYADVDSIPF